jgi:hypothetical protein
MDSQELTQWSGTHSRAVAPDNTSSPTSDKDLQSISGKYFTGERPLYGIKNARVENCTFGKGESPLKEVRNVDVRDCVFKWKYPFWYADHVTVENTVVETIAHAGMWYVRNFTMSDCSLQGTKLFRRSRGITLTNVFFSDAKETLWNCEDITLNHVQANGIYFGMNSKNITADHLNIIGDYAFDGASNITVTNSRIVAKDAFWNTSNVVVKNSFINGEYLAWNSSNLRLENCIVESDQGLCYIDGLTIKNTKLLRTDLAFEMCSHIDAQVTTPIDSIKNPISGRIEAPAVGALISDPNVVNLADTVVIAGGQRITAQTGRSADQSQEHIAGYNE